jgi:hypothetical protein
MTINRRSQSLSWFLWFLVAAPLPSIAEGTDPCAGASSAQTQAHCASRDNANETGTIETVKGVINFAGAAVNLGFFVAGTATQMDYSKVCDSYTFGVSGANIAWDVTAQTTMQNNMQSAAGSIGSLVSFGPQIRNAAKDGLKFGGKGAPVTPGKEGAEKATKGEVFGANSACLINAGTLGATGATNTMTASAARQGARAESAVITPLAQAETGAYTFPSSPHSTGGTAGGYSEGGGTPTQNCMGLSGQAFLSCLGNADPSLSSLFSNPSLKKLNGYKNLDSILKSAIQSNDPSAIKTAASALSGAPISAMDKIAKAGEEATKTQALGNKKAEGPRVLAQARNKNAPDPSDPNYEKLMKEMLEKMLNPNQEANESAEADLDALDRQMDLLSPEQIASRTDISLFHRIAFRYKRKQMEGSRIPAGDPASLSP